MKTNDKAFTLVEVLISLLITGALGVGLSTVISNQKRQQSQLAAQMEEGTQLVQLINSILKIGRLATNCRKVVGTTPVSVSLECTYEISPSITSTVRFLKNVAENKLLFQENVSGTWINKDFYGENGKFIISDFVVCDTTEMQSAGPSCVVPPAAASARYGNISTVNNRFFRFQIKTKSDPSSVERIFQTAFYVRNPSSVGTIKYAWGNK